MLWGKIWRGGAKLFCPRFHIPEDTIRSYNPDFSIQHKIASYSVTRRSQSPSCPRGCCPGLQLPKEQSCQDLEAWKLTMVDMPSFIPRVRSMYSPATIMMKLSRKPKPMKGRELWYASCRNSPGVGLSERDCRESTWTMSSQSTERVCGAGGPFSAPWEIFFVLLHWVSELAGQLEL